MKKVISLTLCILLLFSVMIITPIGATPIIITEAKESGNFNYHMLSDDTAEITAYTGTDTVIEIPSTIDGYTVTSIGDSAFAFRPITEVIIPNTVTDIKYNAFLRCSGLSKVEIPDSVKFIDKQAFLGCESLKEINIPASVEYIGNLTFFDCSGLEVITVDSNNAYYNSKDNCNAIISTATNTLVAGCKNTIIPDTVEIIECYSFGGCTDLTKITIPDSVTDIKYNAFMRCSGLTDVVIPNSVQNIGSGAFVNCTNLEKITISDSVVDIADQAFFGCSSLTEITIPASVKGIGYRAFGECPNLTKLTILSTDCEIGDGIIDAFSYTIVYGYSESTVEAYAEMNLYISFVALPRPIMMGDIDGDLDVNIIDVALIQRYIAKNEIFSDDAKIAADVDGDLDITILDASLIQRYIAKIIIEF